MDLGERKVLVIGSGVIGLTTAVLLKEKGFEPILYSSSGIGDTTSNVAGGHFEPYHVQPANLVRNWASETYTYVSKLRDSGDTRVEFVQAWRVKIKENIEDDLPEWKDILDGALKFNVCEAKDRVKDFPWLDAYSHVHEFSSPIMDTPLFLEGYLQTLKSKGCEVYLSQKPLESMQEACDYAVSKACVAICNCAGLGAKKLMMDESVKPARGALLIYKRPPGADICFSAESGPLGTETNPAYLIPRGKILVAGGTFLIDDIRETLSPEEVEKIDRTAKIFCPALKQPEFEKPIKQVVGFRPYRETGIRVDTTNESSSSGQDLPVFHNYGHGGAGWTLHYGAANFTATAVADAFAFP